MTFYWLTGFRVNLDLHVKSRLFRLGECFCGNENSGANLICDSRTVTLTSFSFADLRLRDRTRQSFRRMHNKLAFRGFDVRGEQPNTPPLNIPRSAPQVEKFQLAIVHQSQAERATRSARGTRDAPSTRRLDLTASTVIEQVAPSTSTSGTCGESDWRSKSDPRTRPVSCTVST